MAYIVLNGKTGYGVQGSGIVFRKLIVKSMSGFVSIDVPKRTGGRQNPSAYSLGFYDFPVAGIK